MSKLEYTTDGIYPEIRGIAEEASQNANDAVYFSHLLVLDDFPQVYYVRNQLTPDLERVREELENIIRDIISMDKRITELTETISNASRLLENTVPEQRKRMIL
jgi:hypothetical protein